MTHRQVSMDEPSYLRVIKKREHYRDTVMCKKCGTKPEFKCPCSLSFGSQTDPEPVEIYPRIFLGSAIFLGDTGFFGKNNIQFVLNCAFPGLFKLLNKKYIVMMSLEANDEENYPIIDLHGEKALEFVKIALNTDKNIYIHCKMGANRSAAIAAYVISRLNPKIKMEDIITSICQKRPCCFSNDYFIRHLLTFQQHRIKLLDPDGSTLYRVYLESEDGTSYPIKTSKSRFLNEIDPEDGIKIKLFNYIKHSEEDLMDAVYNYRRIEKLQKTCEIVRLGNIPAKGEMSIIENIKYDNPIIRFLDFGLRKEEIQLIDFSKSYSKTSKFDKERKRLICMDSSSKIEESILSKDDELKIDEDEKVNHNNLYILLYRFLEKEDIELSELLKEPLIKENELLFEKLNKLH